MADPIAAPNVFDQARQQYPIIDRAGVVGIVTPRDNAGYMEFYPPGEPGSAEAPRPQTLPIDKPGVEIYSGKTTPLDVLGDVTSHHLIKTDPTIKKHYEEFSASLNDQQKQRLQEQYAHAQQNEGEKRPYEEWAASSGVPAYFRGYPFRQWPEEFNQQAYTPQQRQSLDTMMQYLRDEPQAAPQAPAQPVTRLQKMSTLGQTGDAVEAPEPQHRVFPTPPYYSGPGDEALLKNPGLPPDRNTYMPDDIMSERADTTRTRLADI